jgi:hypothetical protein
MSAKSMKTLSFCQNPGRGDVSEGSGVKQAERQEQSAMQQAEDESSGTFQTWGLPRTGPEEEPGDPSVRSWMEAGMLQGCGVGLEKPQGF